MKLKELEGQTMKNVQIAEELFMNVIKLLVLEIDDDDLREETCKQLEEKLDKLVQRDLYTQYKTATTEEEREKARREYLNKKGIPEKFRW